MENGEKFEQPLGVENEITHKTCSWSLAVTTAIRSGVSGMWEASFAKCRALFSYQTHEVVEQNTFDSYHINCVFLHLCL